MSDLVIFGRPELRSPALVASFSGWSDASESASRAVALLRDKLGAQRLAELPGEDFYSPAVLRPTTRIREGRIEALRFSSGVFSYWRNPTGPHDLVLFLGPEPHLNWRRFIGGILDLAQGHGVAAVYTLGAFYDNVPHTRSVRLSATAEDEALRQQVAAADAVFTDYAGPSSLHTALFVAARERGIPSASLWGHVPAYAQVTWNPGVTLALLEALGGMLQLDLDLEDVRTAARYLDEALDKLSVQNPQVRALIRKLEKSYGPAETQRPTETPQVSEHILRQVEEILRQHDADSGQEDEPGNGGDAGSQP